MVPNTRKSLNACTLLRSCGRCVSSTSADAPTKPKFQPTPSTASGAQKCIAVMPDNPLTAPPPAPPLQGGPNAGGQRAGEEAWPIHRHDVPLNAEIGIADGEAAHLHRER